MSSYEAFFIVTAVIGFSLPAAYWQIRRLQQAEATVDRIIREAHERADLAAAIDDLELAYDGPAYDPELDAGCDRLRDALRDHKEGEQP